MNEEKRGYKSRLKTILDEISYELRQPILQKDVAEIAGVTPGTMARWMRPYDVLSQLDFNTLYSLTEAVNTYASKVGKQYQPEQLIEFVGWDQPI